MDAARRRWLDAHPYLDEIARFHDLIEEAVARHAPRPVHVPDWRAYAGDYAEGVPLLQSASTGQGIIAGAPELLRALVDHLAMAPAPAKLKNDCRRLRDLFCRSPEAAQTVVALLAYGCGAELDPAHAGLLSLLGWTALRRALQPTVQAFDRWRDESRWRQGYCPMCGAIPVTARLVPANGGRARLLCCGCCGTRWKYRRVGCPYCGSSDMNRLAIFEVLGEDGYRLDVCEECKGYLKTQTVESEQSWALADWSTIHLDVLAHERGYQRWGTSLYEL